MFGSNLPLFPSTIKNALAGIFSRAIGLVILAFAGFGAISVIRGFGGMATWTTRAVGGIDAGFFTNIVDLCAYALGRIPMLWIFLFMLRPAISLIIGIKRPHPEKSAMQVFVAAVCLSAALASILPGGIPGGVFGGFFANDLMRLFGRGADIILAAVFMILFFVQAAFVLRLTPLRIARFFYKIGAVIDWLVRLIFRRRRADYDDFAEPEPIEAPKRKKKPAAKKKPAKKSKAAEPDEEEIEYNLPPPELLEKSVFSSNAITGEHKQNAANMEINFANYGVKGRVVAINPGPVVTRYDFEPEDGQRIKNITETVVDMTRAMATESIRIALIPKTRFIGVEMVNAKRSPVRYRTMIDAPEFTESKMNVPLALGVEINGRPFYADLTKMPHALVAGRTGSGKSVFVQSLITSIVYRNTPAECRLIIIDPKGVDFTYWDDIPHLMSPIVKDSNAAVNVMKWAVREMEERYKRLQDLGAQNIEQFNEIAADLVARGKTPTKMKPVGTDPETGEIEYEEKELDLTKMPYLAIIIDEVADLMMVARKEIEACVQRLAQKARAAGMHLVAATQRPDTSVITGVIKANFPTRMSFQAVSVIDSMTTLGMKGAEQLLSCGDLLFSEGGKQPMRVHSAYIDTNEIKKIAKFWKAQGKPDYVDGITEDNDGPAIPGMPAGKGGGDSDDLYAQAVEIVRRDKKPTISYVQRRLKVGYGRAAGFIEQMEEQGVIRRISDTPLKYEVA
ncbi:MAG: DUF87 domain-containing protein [Rickettsiales bacterium]|jgi:S-DNA-T family DNA segregation ATPase FtsK/SpoIIIE|nr:DUF87 domain-containing protein [Rickettsiales bacterium]